MHHRDSLGSDVVIHPGELGLMTAGGGIAHSEVSPPSHGPVLHGAQLWVALPDAERAVAPAFDHHAGLPVLTAPGLRATVLLGDVDGAASPGAAFTPIVGVDVELAGPALLPLDARVRARGAHGLRHAGGRRRPARPGVARLPRLRPVVAAPVRRRARAPARCWAASRSRSRS